MDTNTLIVQTTIDSPEAAQALAAHLVERRLAACAQVAGPIQSTYWWKGQIEQATEWVVIAKTRAHLYQAVEDAISARHSYETPDIIAVPITSGLHSYLDWIRTETVPAAP